MERNCNAGTNGKGRLTGASDSAHSLSFLYDSLGRITAKTQVQGTVTKTVNYGYTSGQMTSMTTPSGQAVLYGYNANNQITSISINGMSVLSGVLYDPFGPARGWTWGNGAIAVRTFDTDGKVTQIDSAGFTSYGYDDAFRITNINDSGNSALSWVYGYDVMDRLNSAVKTGQTRGWTYDLNGNRLTETGSSPSTFTVAGTNNRLTGVSGGFTRTYTYNAVGSALTYGTLTYTYNNRGRMKTSKVGTTTTTYVVNALGQRIKKSGGSAGTVLYLYDEAGHLLGEYSSTGVLVQETIWLGDTPVATIRPKTGGFEFFYVHTDHLNTPRRVSRPLDNQLRWRWDSDPFGTAVPNENPATLGAFKYNLRYPGQYFDVESGLNYNYFRDYDAAIGKYVESDPVGLKAGVNTYAYVENNPIMKTDLLGLTSCDGKWVKWGETIPSLPGPGWTLSPGTCFCQWMCVPCRRGIAWSGNVYSLPTTRGIVLVDYSGNQSPNTGSAGIRPTPSGPARGQSGAAGGAYTCICKKPSEETRNGPGCDKCYPDSNF